MAGRTLSNDTVGVEEAIVPGLKRHLVGKFSMRQRGDGLTWLDKRRAESDDGVPLKGHIGDRVGKWNIVLDQRRQCPKKMSANG